MQPAPLQSLSLRRNTISSPPEYVLIATTILVPQPPNKLIQCIKYRNFKQNLNRNLLKLVILQALDEGLGSTNLSSLMVLGNPATP